MEELKDMHLKEGEFMPTVLKLLSDVKTSQAIYNSHILEKICTSKEEYENIMRKVDDDISRESITNLKALLER